MRKVLGVLGLLMMTGCSAQDKVEPQRSNEMDYLSLEFIGRKCSPQEIKGVNCVEIWKFHGEPYLVSPTGGITWAGGN